MKTAGYLLITAGFLAGTLVAVQTEANEITWGYFLPAVALSALGVALARWAIHAETRHEDSVAANVQTLTESIDRVVRNITELDGAKESMHPSDVHGRIDELFPEDLGAFVDARESIGHLYGLQAYAAVMNEFAAGERYLNRVWSASVDGYIDEVREYLGRARHQFDETRRKLSGLTQSGTGA